MRRLTELEGLYLDHHRALGSSPKTITHYRNTFITFHRFLDSVGKDKTADVLVSATFNAFAGYLRESPSKLMRGSTQRSIVTTHGHLKDMRAFVRWLYEEGHLHEVPKVPIPKLPQTLFPVLTEAELAAIYQSKQLATDPEIGKRNRALFSFMLDTGVRLAEVTGLRYEDLPGRRHGQDPGQGLQRAVCLLFPDHRRISAMVDCGQRPRGRLLLLAQACRRQDALRANQGRDRPSGIARPSDPAHGADDTGSQQGWYPLRETDGWPLITGSYGTLPLALH